jgi:hypothetical protein
MRDIGNFRCGARGDGNIVKYIRRVGVDALGVALLCVLCV